MVSRADKTVVGPKVLKTTSNKKEQSLATVAELEVLLDRLQ